MARAVATKGNAKRLSVFALFGTAVAGAVLSGCAGLAPNGSGAGPEALQISPAAISFSNVTVGQRASQDAVLTNAGSETVTISQLAVSTSEFSTVGLATPTTLEPGQSTKFKVVYYSAKTGTTSGELSAMTAKGGGSTRVKLRGASASQQPQLSLSTTSLNFGNVLVNGSNTLAVTLKNNGQADLNISQIALSGTAYSTSGITAPFTLPAGQSTALQATFSPTASGSVSGSIVITSNATNSTATIGLSGTGTAATYTMALAPASVSFGNVNVGSSASQNIQLSNTGNSSVTVTQVTASGQGVSVSGVATPFNLAPSQSATLSVTFSPSAAGTASGSVTVTNNDGVSTVAAVTGAGAQAGLSVTPASASFGTVIQGNTNSQTIQLKNSGNANLTISQATVTGSGFSLSGLSLPMTLTPGQSGTFNVQYSPQSTGSANGTVSIVSNAPNSTATVSLSGSGAAATYTLTLNPGNLSFGSVTTGSSASQSFTVKNTGNSNVSISGITSTGAGYSITSGSGALTLSPNQSTSVSVQFAPTASGSASGNVTVASNATGTNNVALSGTGAAQVQHSAALSWGSSGSSISGYNVYRSTMSGSSYVRINSSLIGGVSYSDASVQSGQTYYYVATAVDSSGNESAFSNEVAAAVP